MAKLAPQTESLHTLADRTRFSVWTTDRLRLADVDHQGHVNNAVHPVLYTNGRYDFIQLHLRPYVKETDRFVLVRISIEYLNEMHFPGEVETGTLVRRAGRSSISFGQALFNEGRCAAVAESIMVLIDPDTRRAKPWPEAATTQLARLINLAAPA